MSGSKVLASEYMLSLGIVSWASIRKGYYPWPPAVVSTSVAFAILSFVSLVDENIAAWLAGGFLLAQLVKAASGTSSIPDAIFNDVATEPKNATKAQRLANIAWTEYALRLNGQAT